MFVTPLQNAIIFTVTTIFNLYISIVVIRFLLQLVRADFYNPVSQLIYKATNPITRPLSKVFPKVRNVDFSVIALALFLQALELTILFYIRGFSVPFTTGAMTGLLLRGAGELLDVIFLIYLVSTFVLVLFSWIAPGQYNPIVSLLAQITDPIYRRVRRILPNTGALDFTPMIIIFVLFLCRILISEPIMYLGNTLIAKG